MATNIFAGVQKMFFPKKMVGIDIGTSSIKIVEVSKWGQGKTLENYGEIKKGSGSLSNYFVSRAVRAVLDEARIRTKSVIFSIPDFSTFCTSIELPPMTKAELPEAIYYNAPQYIPLPITETTLDWKLVEGTPGMKQSKLKIFLVAIPNQTIQDYQNVAKLAGLDLYAVEAEALSLARSLIKPSFQSAPSPDRSICIVDIGVQSTTINIVYKKSLVKSYSFDFSGGQITYNIASALGLSQEQAEDLKNREGLVSLKEEISKILYLLIDPLVIEIKKILADFYTQTGEDVGIIYLTGGTSALPGLKEYCEEVLKKKVEIPNCFSGLLFPPILDETLEKMAPSFSVATGVALGGLDGV